MLTSFSPWGLRQPRLPRSRASPGEARDPLLEEDIAAFRTMLIVRPELVRVPLELARPFFLKGEDRLAQGHFEQVVGGQSAGACGTQRQPAPQPDASAQALEPERRRGARARHQYWLRLGRTLHLHRGPPLPPRPGGVDRVGDRNLGLGGRGIPVTAGRPLPPARYRLRARADVSRPEYKGREFDRMTLSAHLGPRWLIGQYTEASLLASVRQHWQASEVGTSINYAW